MWVCINVTDQRSALSQVQFFFFCWSIHVNDRVIISPFFFFLIYFLHGTVSALRVCCVSVHIWTVNDDQPSKLINKITGSLKKTSRPFYIWSSFLCDLHGKWKYWCCNRRMLYQFLLHSHTCWGQKLPIKCNRAQAQESSKSRRAPYFSLHLDWSTAPYLTHSNLAAHILKIYQLWFTDVRRGGLKCTLQIRATHYKEECQYLDIELICRSVK